MITEMFLLILKIISNQFNDFFVNIGPKLASNIHSSCKNFGKNYFDYLKDPKNSSMYMKPVVEMNITKIIEKFRQNKRAGNDDVGNYIIKRVAKKIVKPLTLIFNVSISTGVVPNKLKIAKIIPIYKNQDTEIFSNYRPVSLLLCFSKILERQTH